MRLPHIHLYRELEPHMNGAGWLFVRRKCRCGEYEYAFPTRQAEPEFVKAAYRHYVYKGKIEPMSKEASGETGEEE